MPLTIWTILCKFNVVFIQSVEEWTANLKCPDISYSPLDYFKPIFCIQKITVPEVLKVISSLQGSKARYAFGLTPNLLKFHIEALVLSHT